MSLPTDREMLNASRVYEGNKQWIRENMDRLTTKQLSQWERKQDQLYLISRGEKSPKDFNPPL